MKKTLLSLAALVLITGCPPPPPLISLFTAAPTSIPADGTKATLVFTATTGSTLAIDNGVGDVTGKTQIDVAPAATTTYTLTATKDGKTETASVTVTVTAAPPLITLFTAAPTAVSAGSSTTLVFTALAGATLSIDNGVGDVSGLTQKSVTPGADTTYTLTATKGGRTATATVTVTVGATPPVGFTVTGLDSVVAGASGNATITAVNATGGTITTYVGTVHFSSDDAAAILPADLAFAAGDAGQKTVAVTFKTAGARLLIANDTASSSAQGFGRIVVTPGPTSALALSAAGAAAAAGDAVAITVTLRDAYGNQATGYTGTVNVSTGDPLASAPATLAFGAGDQGSKTFGVSFGQAGSWSVTVTDQADASLTATTSNITVGPGAIAQFSVNGPADATVDVPATYTVLAEDRFGNVLTGYAGSVHVVSDDPGMAPLPDASFTNGVATFDVTYATAGDHSIAVVPVSGPGLGGDSFARVHPGTATHYALSALPGSASAGDPIALTITALDAHENVVSGYAQQAHLSSGDATDQLPPDSSFSGGVATVSLAFVRAGSHSVTVSEVGGTITATSSSTSVSAAAPMEISMSTGGGQVAGVASSVTLTVLDRFGNVASGYRGTVSFTSTDSGATLPGAYTFVAGDAGAHAFSVTFTTAGDQQLSAGDGGALSSVGHFSVAPAAASQCAVTGVPASAVAGAQLQPVVTFHDAFGNVATGYTGTVSITTTATNAVLPPASSVPGGSRAFQVQILSAGAATITASDSTLSCNAAVSVTPAGARYTVSFASDANASWPANGSVAVKDAYGNAITTYAGVLHFASTDAAGVAPADVTLTGSQGGVASFSFTFNTMGAQTITVSDPASVAISGTAGVNVHGLVYADPTAGAGKIRVVMNAANTTAGTVQLDVVSNAFAVTSSNGVYRRGGVFSTGLNLPLSGSRVVAGTPLLAEPAAPIIPTGTAPKAVASSMPTSGPASGMLLVALSGKRVGAGGTGNDVNVAVGSVLYSVRLRIAQAATAGTVFDGSALPATYRAAVRSITGDDFASSADFALGKLQVQ